jgi:lipopolysaccharide/colanic/teichoic acid biosynthesis glycosyltransferase
VGFLTDDGSAGEAVTCRLSQSHGTLFRAPILGGLPALEPLVSEHGIDEILIADPAVVSDTRLLHQIIQACRARGLTVGVVPQMGDIRADQLHVDDVGTVSILRPHARSGGGPRGLAKRGLDIAVSLVLLVMTAPLWALAAVLIRLDGPGPVFFRQRRIGLNGRPFVLIKFRTMHSDADPYAPSVDGLSDSRVTRFGRFLRQGGFDELPQLLNVLRGEMSLVGPRPEMPFIVDGYGVIERQRLRVKPGITGIWQLSADRLGQIHESLEYDLYYLQHQSLLLDVLVLLETFIFALQVPVRVAGSALRKARNEPRRGGPPDRPGGPGSRPGPRSNGRRAGGSRASRGASAKGST